VGSGQIGYDPFDRRTWSGISYFLFGELQRRGALHRAFGVEVPKFRKFLLMAREFHPNTKLWRYQYYASPRYRNELTKEVRKRLLPSDSDHDVLQIGAMYDVPRLMAGRCRCFSYHDGNMALAARSPYQHLRLSRRRLEAGLAFERAVYGRIDRIFTMSEFLRRSFLEDYGVPAERVSAIGAGVNLDAMPEAVPDRRYDTKAVLFIGSDFERKGGPQLLAAFRRVREIHREATLHIVGPRSLQIAPELSGGVTYHGYLRKTDPADAARLESLFRSCSLFVLPSLYEPFGIAPLEAMVHQIPALVSRGWALQETVTPGVTGEHVEPGSVDDLVTALRDLLGDPDRLRRLGTAAREECLAKHNWTAVVDRMFREIRDVQKGNLPGCAGPPGVGRAWPMASGDTQPGRLEYSC
jgi:glycosyltransferase involved in cell wall biosynthesis